MFVCLVREDTTTVRNVYHQESLFIFKCNGNVRYKLAPLLVSKLTPLLVSKLTPLLVSRPTSKREVSLRD